MLFGGTPLGERHMFWNFVSSRPERIEQGLFKLEGGGVFFRAAKLLCAGDALGKEPGLGFGLHAGASREVDGGFQAVTPRALLAAGGHLLDKSVVREAADPEGAQWRGEDLQRGAGRLLREGAVDDDGTVRQVGQLQGR